VARTTTIRRTLEGTTTTGGETVPTTTTHRHRLTAADCRLADLLAILAEPTDLAAYPTARRVEQGVVVYEAATVRAALAQDRSDDVAAELVHAFTEGPGIVLLAGAFEASVVDRVTEAYERIVAEEKAAGGARGDHFGTPGANDRIWNALEKLAVADPAAFVDYYSNDVVALAARAWLGPGYQVTAQANIVRPGGKGQTVHRDYHLGFMDSEQAARHPRHVHALSPVLTLQGAVAHVDMPVESGPTLYLPHSQKYEPGYLAYWLPEFQDYFVEHHIQLALAKGDLVFFNPALFHAAGSNVTTDVQRVANLLQISSAFGRAMETIDRERVVNAVYPTLLAAGAAGLAPELVANAVAASAEGYAFPTNLDLDQPVGSMAPPSQADLVAEALAAGTSPEELAGLLSQRAAARASH
jgi:ectoine hydroxylase-related dioxygenase (phytanoyl-CoA dioxygenase family)